MGSATSKVLRRAAKPTAIYHKPPSGSEDSVTGRSIKPNNDQDNNLVARIRHLGPVYVDHGIYSSLSPSFSRKVYQPTLVFPVQTLHEVLDKRKSVTSPLVLLAEHYDIDHELLDQLVNVVNSPSVQAGTGVRFISYDTGQEVFRRTALWVNPQI